MEEVDRSSDRKDGAGPRLKWNVKAMESFCFCSKFSRRKRSELWKVCLEGSVYKEQWQLVKRGASREGRNGWSTKHPCWG